MGGQLMTQTVWRLRIFGDSIMRGILYDESEGDYVQLINDAIPSQYTSPNIHIHNSSFFGYTSTKGLQLLQRAITRGLVSDMVILEYGGNDCDYRWKEVAAAPEKKHEPRTPLEQFDDTIRSMISLLKAEEVTPILMTLPPINANLYLEHLGKSGLDPSSILQWLGHSESMYLGQEAYSERIREIAIETNTLLIDIRTKFLRSSDYSSLLCKDGIHPNVDGHKLIWSTVGDMLMEVKTA